MRPLLNSELGYDIVGMTEVKKELDRRAKIIIRQEKQIKELKEENKQLKAQSEKLEARCNELFFQVNEQIAQIEKMKCCENCEHSDTECEGHTICSIGQFDDCLDNKMLYHTTNEKHYWELLKE